MKSSWRHQSAHWPSLCAYIQFMFCLHLELLWSNCVFPPSTIATLEFGRQRAHRTEVTSSINFHDSNFVVVDYGKSSSISNHSEIGRFLYSPKWIWLAGFSRLKQSYSNLILKMAPFCKCLVAIPSVVEMSISSCQVSLLNDCAETNVQGRIDVDAYFCSKHWFLWIT